MMDVEDPEIVSQELNVAQNCASRRKFTLDNTKKINELNRMLYLSCTFTWKDFPSNVGLAKLISYSNLYQTFHPRA